MVRPSYTQSGAAMFDYAINGVPFLAGQTQQYAYKRDSADARKEQLDTTGSPGEASLTGWWYRSQVSFHLGAGALWLDAGRDDTKLQYQYADSQGVNPWTPGVVSLLKSTSLGVSTSSSNATICSYSNSGEDGVLLAEHGNTVISKYTSAGATANNSGLSGTIKGLATNRNQYFVSTTTGIFAGDLPVAAAGQQYDFPGTVTTAKLAWAKGRLWASCNRYLYALSGWTAGAATALGTDPTLTGETAPLMQHPTNGWAWTSIADGPDGVFASGYESDYSEIYYCTFDAQASDYTTPSVVATIPRGEIIYTMESYLGAYLILGTSKGVRVALVGSNGKLDIGPLSVKTELPCYDVAVYGNYIWAAGCTDAPSAPLAETATVTSSTSAGLYRLDLSQTSQTDVAMFPYARDLLYTVASGTTGGATAVATIGQTGRLAFYVSGKGLVVEHATTRVASGWLETGRIRMGTLENKVYQALRVINYDRAGTIAASYRSNTGTLTAISSWDPDVYSEVNLDGSDGSPHMWNSYRFTLTRSAADTSVSPGLWAYQVRSNPSGTTQRTIQVPLMCMEREVPANGPPIERPVWDRVTDLETVQDDGQIVRFQDFGTGEDVLVVVDGVTFISTVPPRTPQGRAQRGGVLVALLRVVG